MLRFATDMVIDTPNGNRAFKAGDVIEPAEVLPGCVESCLRLGTLIEVPVEKPKQQTPTTTTSAGKAKPKGSDK